MLLRQAYSLGVASAVLLLAASAVHSPAQLKVLEPSAAKAEPAASIDPLKRETPRSTTLGFLTYERRGDYATAARYLQLRPEDNTDLDQLAKELRALNPHFKGNINLLSDDPNGTVDAGLPPGQVRAGVITIGNTNTDVILVRVDDPVSGRIWLVSKETIDALPKLYALVESEAPTTADRFRATLQSGPQLLQMSSMQWLGWLLSIPISWVLAWLLSFVISAPRRAWCRIRKVPLHTVWETPLGIPLRCLLAILLHGFCVYLLQPPLVYRVYYIRFLAALMAGCFGWLVSRASDQGFDVALNRTRTHRGGGESILILMQRLNRVGIFVIALICALALLGVNVSATLTGLGIGGLAVALAAQKTLENIIGGVSLLMDRALQVGDFCKVGDRMGTVEDIGLRSIKIRTLDQNLLVIPNGSLAQMQFENMKSRTKLLIDENFSLRIETQVEQLRFVLDGVQRALDEDPRIEGGTSRVRVTNFAGAAFQLHLFAYGKTGDMKEFTVIRQEVLLKIVKIVEAAGARFAGPTRLTYLHTDAGVDAEGANDIVSPASDADARTALVFPGEVRTETK